MNMAAVVINKQGVKMRRLNKEQKKEIVDMMKAAAAIEQQMEATLEEIQAEIAALVQAKLKPLQDQYNQKIETIKEHVQTQIIDVIDQDLDDETSETWIDRCEDWRNEWDSFSDSLEQIEEVEVDITIELLQDFVDQDELPDTKA